MGGGGGSSQANTTTTTTTQNTDKRMVLDGSSVGVSADGGSAVTINNTSTDQGAIKGAGDIALAAIGSNSTNFDHLLATADHLMTQQQSALDANTSLTRDLAGTAQTAYADAAAQASGNKNLILMGMAVVGVVAFTALGKK